MAITINRQAIGNGHRCYIVAELSGNHGGKFERAIKLIDAAKSAGADAVKVQVYKPNTITLNSCKSDFTIPENGPWGEFHYLYELYQHAFTPWEWIPELSNHANLREIDFFGSVFDHSSIDLMESLNVPAYKIASPEITDIPLLEAVAKTGRPLMISTGLAELSDIELAIDTIRKKKNNQIILLKCTTDYPTPYKDVNLAAIADLRERFQVDVGLSDHSESNVVAVASIGVGVSVLEKHLTLDEELTVDSFFSLNSDEFKDMVTNVRAAEEAIGEVTYRLSDGASRNWAGRRSLYVCQDIRASSVFTKENIKSVRPGYGLHPKYYEEILGRRAKRDLKIGDRLSWDVIDGGVDDNS